MISQVLPNSIRSQNEFAYLEPVLIELRRHVHLNVIPQCQTMAAEDMSYFLQEVPGCYFFLGSANAAKGLNYPHHHPRFTFDEAALVMGVEMFVRCVHQFCV